MAFVSAFQQHVKTLQPALPFLTPADSNFEATRACYVKRDGNTPAAVARPQNAAHVQALIQYCTKNGVDFVVRSGGHDCAARSQVNGSLSIDMRDIKHIKVSADKKTVSVGGGILTRDLAKGLDAQGLVTPVGSVGSVGHIGWATLGGYGPLTPRYGLGVDQIVGAKLVNPKGELIDAGPELLQGLRGGGGTFGIVVELTVKVYPLKGLLSSLIVYDSTDPTATWANFAAGYERMVAEGSLPPALLPSVFGLELPGLGKVIAVSTLWADDDHEEGKKWISRVASFNKCLVNKPPELKSVAAYTEFNETLVTYGSYGRSYTLNVRKQTMNVSEALGKATELLPGGGMTILAYAFRPTGTKEDSVIGLRESHFLCEFIGTTPVRELEAKGAEWSLNAMAEIRKEPGNVFDSAYVALLGDDDCDYKKVYGENYDKLLALKKKYDPENVFKHAVPRLLA